MLFWVDWVRRVLKWVVVVMVTANARTYCVTLRFQLAFLVSVLQTCEATRVIMLL